MDREKLIQTIEKAQSTYSTELTRKMAEWAADAILKNHTVIETEHLIRENNALLKTL